MTSSPEGTTQPVLPAAPAPGAAALPAWSPRQRAAASRLVGAGLNNATLDRLVELASKLLGTVSAQVSLLTEVQTAVAAHGVPPGTVGRGVPFEDSICLLTATAGVPLAIPDARTDARVAGGATVLAGHIAGYLGVPLVDDAGVTIGSLCVFDPEPREWDDHDVALLEQLAASARAELELAALSRQYEADRARWELAVQASDVGTFDWDLRSGDLAWDDRLIALYGYETGDVGFDRSIGSVQARVHPDDQELVTRAMAGAIEAVGPISVVYRIVVPPGRVRWLEARGRATPDPADPTGPAVRLHGISWDVTDQQEGQAHADRVLASMPLGYLALDRNWRVTAVNAEGARLTGSTVAEMLGADVWELRPALLDSPFETTYRRVAATGISETVEAFYPEPFNSWFEVRVSPDVDGIALYFLDVTARHENQVRLELAAQHDRTVAQTLQSVLLTELPQAPGLESAGRYLTAAASDEVGGDWYDAVVQPDGSLTAMIGDVVGHDIAAAAVMGQLRSMLRMAAWASSDRPSGLIRQLDLASRDLHVDALATMAVCRIEPSATAAGDRVMTWSNAGHPPPVLVHPDGTTHVLGGGTIDVLVGVAPGNDRHDHRVLLPAGSTVVLYTDGLIETRDSDIDVGVDRLCAAAARHHRAAPAELAEALLQELVGAVPGDDTAVLAIRVVRPVVAGTDVLEPDIDAPGRARRVVAGVVAGLPDEVADDALVMVSELVGNAVRHGRGAITLRVERTAAAVRVEVADGGAALPPAILPAPSSTRSHGRGLLIVDTLASRWGTTAAAGGFGKTVWFELDV